MRRYDRRVRPASRITAWFAVALTVVLAAACDGFVGEIALVRVKPPRADSPSALVESFFRDYPHRLTGGLPAGEELRWIRPLLSDRLYVQFVSTLQYQREWIQRNPDRPSPDGGPPIILKPPFADGVHFDGSPDGHKSFKVVRTVPQSTDTSHVHIRFWWDPALAGWEHVVIVKSQRDRYVIDDVRFGPDTPGERTILLSEILASREPA